MKKISILLFFTGLAILYGLSWLYPVPAVSPVRIKDRPEDRRAIEKDVTTSLRSGEFVFPYYRTPMDHKPTWIFRGSTGNVIRDKHDRITVQNPRITHYPPSQEQQNGDTPSRNVETVTITGGEGHKQTTNVAFVKEDVRVRTDQGGELTTRQLYADFKNDRLYTRSNHEIMIDRSGLYVEGIGFSGNSRLSRFHLKKNVYLRLSTSQLRSLSGKGMDQAVPKEDPPYFITAEGPLHARLVDETKTHRTWKLSVSDKVYLYQMLQSGALRQYSDQLHLTLLERKDRSNNEKKPSSGENTRSNFQISSFKATGQVHIDDRGLEIWSDHVQMIRKERTDVFHLKGDSQKINFNKQATNESNYRSSAKRPSHQQTPTTTAIRVSGTGRLERPRPSRNPERKTGTSSGKARFTGRVFVRRNDTRLQSNRLSVSFSRNSDNNQSSKDRRADLSNLPLQIRFLDARENVLFLNDDVATTGEHLTWNPVKRKMKVRSNQESVITNLHNKIQGRRINIDRATSSLTATRNVQTTFSTEKNRGFQLLGLSDTSDTSAGSGKESSVASGGGTSKWHLDSDQLTLKRQPESSRLRSLDANGNVQISSDQVDAYGNRFEFKRPESNAVLHGKREKARLHQNRHSAFADSFQFQLDHKNVILKGQKRLRMNPEPDASEKENKTEGGRTNVRKGPFDILSGSPMIIHRRQGRIRVLGPARVQKPGGRMRGRQANVQFDPETRELHTVRVNGDVFLSEQAGAATGDLAKWNVRTNRLKLRGQPSALVNRNGRIARYEIITLWNNWSNLRGKRYKWPTPGTIQGNE